MSVRLVIHLPVSSVEVQLSPRVSCRLATLTAASHRNRQQTSQFIEQHSPRSASTIQTDACEMSSLSQKQTWDDYYSQHPHPIDWYSVDWCDSLTSIVDSCGLSTQSALRVLHTGCGNSELPAELAQKWTNSHWTNIDFVESIIAKESKRHSHNPRMHFATVDLCDANQMSQFVNAFDLVIDKGTLDCILLNEAEPLAINAALLNMSRALRQGGVALCLSVHAPDEQVHNRSMRECMQHQELNCRFDYSCIAESPLEMPHQTSIHQYKLTRE